MNAAVVILAPHTVPRMMDSPTSRRLLTYTDATDRPIAAPTVPPMIDPFIESLAIVDDNFIDICLFTVHFVSIDYLFDIIYSTLLAQPCFTTLIPGISFALREGASYVRDVVHNNPSRRTKVETLNEAAHRQLNTSRRRLRRIITDSSALVPEPDCQMMMCVERAVSGQRKVLF